MSDKETFVLFAKNKEATTHKEMVSTSGWMTFDSKGKLIVVNKKSDAKRFEAKDKGHGSPEDWAEFFNSDPDYNKKYSFSYSML